jgi:protein MpaA
MTSALRSLRLPAVLAAAALVAALIWILLRAKVPAVQVAGHSVEGRPIEFTVWGRGERVVLFMASIHGSEGAGTPLLRRLAQHFEENPDSLRGVTVLLLPVANPDGLLRGERLNRNGVDLNRNFAANNRRDSERFGLKPLSEPESRALAALIEKHQPQLIVSIHQPEECVDWDGPPQAEAMARRLAAACALPVRKLGARPGSLGSWFGEVMGRPILTLEMPRDAPMEAAPLWERYGAGLLGLLQP